MRTGALPAAGALVALASALGCGPAEPGSPFAVEVLSFSAGEGAGFGKESNVLGPPEGGGEGQGSLDVLSLGLGGEIVVRLGEAAVDGPGADLLVFENVFAHPGGLFREPGEVSVSPDSERWETFPCEPEGELVGCAGRELTYAHPDNEIDPRDPDAAGGDAFDLAAVGLAEAWYVRVVDPATGSAAGAVENAGFDLDAVAAVHTAFD